MLEVNLSLEATWGHSGLCGMAVTLVHERGSDVREPVNGCRCCGV